jgi:hypothetical protein
MKRKDAPSSRTPSRTSIPLQRRCLYAECMHGQARKQYKLHFRKCTYNHCGRVVRSIPYLFGDLCSSSESGAFCYCSEWLARAKILLLPKTKSSECVTFLPEIPRGSISSQAPSLPKFNFGATLPTKCTNYSVLPNASIWHYICTLNFISI